MRHRQVNDPHRPYGRISHPQHMFKRPSRPTTRLLPHAATHGTSPRHGKQHRMCETASDAARGCRHRHSEHFCDTSEAARCQQSEQAMVAQAAVSCATRAAAAPDTPSKSIMSMRMSCSPATAVPWSTTSSLTCRDGQAARSASTGRQEGVQGRGGAHPAAPGTGGANSSWTPWSFAMRFEAAHAP